jgi:hypothetical protein
MGDAEKVSPQAAVPPQEAKKENFLPTLLVWCAIGIIVGAAAYFLLFAGAPSPTPTPIINNTITPTPQPVPTGPAEVSAIVISEPSCPECNSTSVLLDQIVAASSQLNLKVTSTKNLQSGSSDAQALITKYSITKLPALIMSKEANASSTFVTAWARLGSRAPDGSFIYQESYPPYFDLAKGQTVGLVSLVEIPASSCSNCFNVSLIVDSLAGSQVRMAFTNETVVSANSTQGLALVAKYNITRLPAFLLSPDAAAYAPVVQSWSQVGDVASDGWFIYRGVMPPYVDLTKKGAVVGLVTMIELTDPSCTACYNVSLHYASLKQQVGMEFASVTAYNISGPDGKKYIAKYNITEVPTVLLSPEAFLYPSVNASWQQIGTKEKDGWLVYRNISALGVVYRDLITGNVTGNRTISAATG